VADRQGWAPHAEGTDEGAIAKMRNEGREPSVTCELCGTQVNALVLADGVFRCRDPKVCVPSNR
jgi:hypothetical protein